MKVIDRLRSIRFTNRADEVESPPKATFIEEVYSAPVDHNRAARRSVGLTVRRRIVEADAAGILRWVEHKLWRWDSPPRAFIPRYFRRHYQEDPFTHPKNRRQRKMRARISRTIAAKGIVR